MFPRQAFIANSITDIQKLGVGGAAYDLARRGWTDEVMNVDFKRLCDRDQ